MLDLDNHDTRLGWIMVMMFGGLICARFTPLEIEAGEL